MVERTLPKPDTRVRFPSAAPLRSPAQRLETSFLGFQESLTLKNRPIKDDFLPPARQPLYYHVTLDTKNLGFSGRCPGRRFRCSVAIFVVFGWSEGI